MRKYGYVRTNLNQDFDIEAHLSKLDELGHHLKRNRLIVEQVLINKSICYRDKFISLFNYALDEGDFLIIKNIDCLGNCFEEILETIEKLDKKKVRLVCLDFSNNEISGEIKNHFIKFLKMCNCFEVQFSHKKNISRHEDTPVRKVGRPEVLNDVQKREVIDLFKNGYSIYYLAKEYSVARTVIQRILKKTKDNLE
ncbi:recombinase family protein [Acinetobacter sp.]|jgi:putative DNA-invertase from lambdoid prophage Rac|uniref:recombinase family protein n=1 Tax=Acinetobacter sp. TaxID=472 RepID=UPI0028211A73|nr:recombinase family protein [Acinetobacter sp.]MDR0238034.1 recombinase family protein [Acinetobacter sp.]